MFFVSAFSWGDLRPTPPNPLSRTKTGQVGGAGTKGQRAWLGWCVVKVYTRWRVREACVFGQLCQVGDASGRAGGFSYSWVVEEFANVLFQCGLHTRTNVCYHVGTPSVAAIVSRVPCDKIRLSVNSWSATEPFSKQEAANICVFDIRTRGEVRKARNGHDQKNPHKRQTKKR